MKNNKHPVIKVSLVVLVILIYTSTVYESWANIEELFKIIPSFITTALAIGLFLSIMSFKKPLLTTFLITSFAPISSFLIYFLLILTVPISEAGMSMQDTGTPHFLNYLYSISFIFSIIISILFGLISVFGCFMGGRISSLLSDTYRIHSSTNDDAEIKSARIGALTTLTMGTISAIVSILIAYIK